MNNDEWIPCEDIGTKVVVMKYEDGLEEEIPAGKFDGWRRTDHRYGIIEISQDEIYGFIDYVKSTCVLCSSIEEAIKLTVEPILFPEIEIEFGFYTEDDRGLSWGD